MCDVDVLQVVDAFCQDVMAAIQPELAAFSRWQQQQQQQQTGWEQRHEQQHMQSCAAYSSDVSRVQPPISSYGTEWRPCTDTSAANKLLWQSSSTEAGTVQPSGVHCSISAVATADAHPKTTPTHEHVTELQGLPMVTGQGAASSAEEAPPDHTVAASLITPEASPVGMHDERWYESAQNMSGAKSDMARATLADAVSADPTLPQQQQQQRDQQRSQHKSSRHASQGTLQTLSPVDEACVSFSNAHASEHHANCSRSCNAGVGEPVYAQQQLSRQQPKAVHEDTTETGGRGEHTQAHFYKWPSWSTRSTASDGSMVGTATTMCDVMNLR